MGAFSIRSTVSVAAALLLGLAAASPVAAAPAACAGSGWVAPIGATFQSRAAGQATFVTFEFFGQHPLCLADGSQVTGEISGRLWERLGPGGLVGLRFAEVLSYDGGTLGYAGDAAVTPAGWDSHVRTVGAGTGILAGIEGQGQFSPIDPNTGSFSDVISYTYH